MKRRQNLISPMSDTTPQLQQPAEQSQKPAGIEARVFTMPERYRHGAEGKVHEPETKGPRAPVEIKTPSVPSAPALPPRPPARQKKISSTKKILLLGAVVLLALGVGGTILVSSVEEQGQEEIVTAPVVRPEPQPTPEPEPEPEPAGEPEPEPEVFPVEVLPGTDSDSDGLSDTEERTIYGTDVRLPDSDTDGFLDGNEVFHRYNPAALGTLLAAGVVTTWQGETPEGEAGVQRVEYAFDYPTVWEMEFLDGELVLDAQIGEGFRISFVEKQVSLAAWASENVVLEDSIFGTTKNGLQLLQSSNQLEAYVDLGLAVMIVKYDTGVKARVDYLQTMQMMLNSVRVVNGSDEPL